MMEKGRVLITGADGFIGSHLTELLLKEGHTIRAIAQYNSLNNWGWLEDINCKNDVEVITGDIRDPFFCKSITRNVDTVFHLAALIGIPYSYLAPSSYVETNVQGTLNICQASLENNVGKIIHTSTSEVYGTAQYVPIDENHILQPQSPYSASKIAADAMAQSYFNSFDLPLIIARPFNTYGPRQSARAIIPSIITQISSGKKEIRLGDLRPTRDLNYVEDTCRGFMALANSENLDSLLGEVVNIGSNYEISMEEVLNIIKDVLKSDISIIQDPNRLRPKKSEVTRLWCNNEKLVKLTGFKHVYGIREGLEKTIEWFSDPYNLGKYKPDIYNV